MQLYKHQEQALQFLRDNMFQGALFMEVGTGKTITALAAFKELRETNPCMKLLVVCPITLIESAWMHDASLHFEIFKCSNLKKSVSGDILLINYESFILKKYQRIIQELPNPKMIVVDESSRMKNNKTKTTKTFLACRDLFKYRLVMSGTPAPNSEYEYWAQMEFVKPGILHPSFYGFRNTYFHLSRGNQIFHGQKIDRHTMSEMFKRGFKYDITQENRKLLFTIINRHAFWAKKKDCLDLPNQVDEVRLVDLTEDQRHHYNEMKRELITEIGNSTIIAPIFLAKIMKLRQITSGFAINDAGEAVRMKEKSPKLQELMNILEEIGDNQVIIWVQFHEEVDIIKEALPDAETLYSRTPDKTASIDRFKNGEAKYLIAHPRSAGHGLTFTNCSYQIFFSLDYSFEAHEQARGRIHRIGQENKCTYVYLMARNTIDERILHCLRTKEDLTKFALETLRLD